MQSEQLLYTTDAGMVTTVTELAVIESFLPAQMSAEEIEAQVKTIIAETGAAGMKDLGKVMPAAMKAMGGVADGKLISEAVKKLLA